MLHGAHSALALSARENRARRRSAALPPGVAVLTPDDVRELGRYGCQIKDQTVLAIERARFVGDAVAAVAAETEEAAEEALASIDVEYEELPAVVGIDEALTGRTLVHERIQVSDNDAAYFGIRPEQGTNVCHRFRIVHGDAGAGLRRRGGCRRGDVPHGGGAARADGAARHSGCLGR